MLTVPCQSSFFGPRHSQLLPSSQSWHFWPPSRKWVHTQHSPFPTDIRSVTAASLCFSTISLLPPYLSKILTFFVFIYTKTTINVSTIQLIQYLLPFGQKSLCDLLPLSYKIYKNKRNYYNFPL